MSIEGIRQGQNQYTNKTAKKTNTTIPKALGVKGKITDVKPGGLSSIVAAGLEEIKKFNKKNKLKKAVSQKLLSILGIDNQEQKEEEPGGLKTVAKGLREVLKNLKEKTNRRQGQNDE